MKKHNYQIKVEWTGNEGNGTLNYKSYNRNHTIITDGKYDVINGSSDPSFLGDKTKYNPYYAQQRIKCIKTHHTVALYSIKTRTQHYV